MNIYLVYLSFWIFSILGWIMEVIVCSICDKRLVNRGFLIGPYCPIYGFGSLLMLIITPYQDNPLVCFILALVLCSVLEYLTSYLMEKMFKVRWWDYSNDSFNINGRICLRNAIAFGALGVLFTRYLNPLFMNIFGNIDVSIIKTISIIILIITTIDIIVSFNVMHSVQSIINNNLSLYINKDATTNIKKLISNKLSNINFLEKRLIKTYHLLEKEKDKIKEKIKNQYSLLLIFNTLGIVIGLILSLVLKLGEVKIIVPFTISISSLIAFLIMNFSKK